MKIDDFMNKPSHLGIEEYEALLKKKESIYRRLKKVCEKEHDEDDAMSVFETCSDGYNYHLKKRTELELKHDKLLDELRKVNKRLEG